MVIFTATYNCASTVVWNEPTKKWSIWNLTCCVNVTTKIIGSASYKYLNWGGYCDTTVYCPNSWCIPRYWYIGLQRKVYFFPNQCSVTLEKQDPIDRMLNPLDEFTIKQKLSIRYFNHFSPLSLQTIGF